MFRNLKAGVASVAALVLSGTAASAGGLADEIVEAPVMVEEPVEVAAAGSLPGWVIPVALLAVFIGVAANGSDDEPEDEGPKIPDGPGPGDINKF